MELIYPIGAVYKTYDSINPAELFGGTWEKMNSENNTPPYEWKRIDFAEDSNQTIIV